MAVELPGNSAMARGMAASQILGGWGSWGSWPLHGRRPGNMSNEQLLGLAR